MSDDTIAKNIAGIEGSLRQMMTFGDGPSDAVLANNADWLDKLSYIELLREVGVHFSVNRMLSFDSVRSRLEREQGLTFLEFNYSIDQARLRGKRPHQRNPAQRRYCLPETASATPAL